MRTREEHIEQCKAAAREYLKRGQLVDAVTSMMSDLQKHPETAFPPEHALSQLGLMAAMSHDRREVERYIEGFH